MATSSTGRNAEKKNSQLDTESYVEFPLTRINFILMAASGVAIILGFLLMLGGSTTTEAFNPDIFSTRRIVVGPAISFLGFAFMAYAIICRPKHNNKQKADKQ
jgi:succinate dehydrogenase/fumarate reductase cytochrome b subunit